MISNIEQGKRKEKLEPGLDKIRNYNEIVEYLDGLKTADYSEASLRRMKELDIQFQGVASKIDIIVVAGTNGKSLSMHFAAKLLKEEGFKVGIVYSSHLLNYTERMLLNVEQVNNKIFTDAVNEVINVAISNNIKATVHEILIMASLKYFHAEKCDVVMLEANYGGKFDAVAYCNPKIAAVTRVTEDARGLLGSDMDQVAFELSEIAKSGSWFISAEQSKLRLQKMKTWCEERNIKWAMPIRKLAILPYIYEQLYGRVASLGERIAQIYVEDIKGKFSPFLRGNLLATQKGQRGRPTLAAKRNAELNPLKTLKTFWADQFDLLHGRFELLDKENPSMLLDNASNLDALSNLFLGIRLIHYQKPIKGLAIVLGLSKAGDVTETLKLIRYLLKKVSGQIFFVSLQGDVVGYDVNELSTMAKELNIKAKACNSLTEALMIAKASVDERDGLVVVAGSTGLVSEFWKLRGIKKF